MESLECPVDKTDYDITHTRLNDASSTMSSRFVYDIYLLWRPLRRSYSASVPENFEENCFEISERVYTPWWQL